MSETLFFLLEYRKLTLAIRTNVEGGKKENSNAYWKPAAPFPSSSSSLRFLAIVMDQYHASLITSFLTSFP